VNADGAGFAAQAVERGAAAVLASRPLELNVPVVISPIRAGHSRSPRRGFMASLPAGFRSSGDGTNGKTTTAYLNRPDLRRARRAEG